MRPFVLLALSVSLGSVGAACGSSDTAPAAGAGVDASTPDGGSTFAIPDASGDGAASSCEPLGTACTSGAGCCSAYCKASVCTCNSDGYACGSNVDCCASDCVNGKCGGTPDGATSSAPAGALDTAYGSHGCTTLAYAGDAKNNSTPSAAALDGAGNLYVVGGTETDGIGDTDASMSGWFTVLGPSGAATTNALLPTTFGPIYRLALSPAGAPIVVGDGTPVVMRTNGTGVADPSFSFDDGDAGGAGSSLAPQSTGKTLFGGGTEIYRVDSTGAFDTSFGAGGVLAFATAALPLSADAFLVDATDRIYVAGVASLGGVDHWYLARFSADGVLDTTFGSQGLADAGPAPYFSGYLAHFTLVASHAGADFYVLATYQDPNLSYTPAWIVHAGVNGVDATYGGAAGHAVVAGPALSGGYTNNEPTFDVVDAAVQDDGKLVIAGTDGAGFEWYLTRLDLHGAVDTSYGASGWVDTAASSDPGGANPTVYGPVAIEMAPDGGMVVVQRKQYLQNLYSEESAVVCKYTP